MPRDFAQPGQSLAHVVFYGLAAYAEGPGYLVVGEVVKAVHGEYPAALFGHGVDGQLHQFEKVGGGDFFLGLGGGLLRMYMAAAIYVSAIRRWRNMEKMALRVMVNR